MESRNNNEYYTISIKKFIFIVLLGFFALPAIFAVIWSDGTGTVFNTDAGVLCSINSTGSFWSQGNTVIDSATNCYIENGINSNGNTQTTCCPSGFSCNQTSNNCELSAPSVDSCSDYQTESACDNYNLNAVKDSIEANSGLDKGNFCDNEYVNLDQCVYYGSCGCKWTNGQCKDSYVSGNPCDSGESNQKRCEITKNEVIDKCGQTENTYVLTWERKLFYLNGSLAPAAAWCSSGSKTFSCPSQQRSLPFFSIVNMMLSLLVIFGVYFLVYRKGK